MVAAEDVQPDIERARHIMWTVGDLSWTLLRHQEQARAWWLEQGSRRTVWNCARRWGKSRLMLTLAYETALQIPGAQIMYAASTQKQVRKILLPHIRDLSAEAPPGFAPKYDRDHGAWRFPSTDALLHLAGCDKEADRENLRGIETHLGIIDEAGSIDDLHYLVQSILLPQTLACDGRLVIVSTPPKTPDHEFRGYISEAQAGGYYIERNIYTASHVGPDKIEEYKAETGGEETSDWQREYLCQLVVDKALAVIPEFHDHEEEIVQAVERPHFYDTYASLDVGYHDLTFALFGYWHFPENTLVIEDERTWQHTNSQRIVADCLEAERRLWGHGREQADPNEYVFRRVADAPEILLADLVNVHGYRVSPTRKDDKDAQINALRLAVAGSGRFKLRIHPRCVALRAHLRHAVWNRGRTSFDRSGDLGHFDGVDALLYLCRNVSFSRNPYPRHWQGERDETHHIPTDTGPSDGLGRAIRDMFRRRR